MAPDYKQILEKINERTKGGGEFDYLDLDDGDNIVRWCPAHPNMEAFFVEVYFHSKKDPSTGKNMMVICLNHGDPEAGVCEICPTLEPLRNSKDKAEKKQYNAQKAKPRYFSNVIDRSDQKRKIMGYGSMILKPFLGYITSEEYGEEVLDPLKGYDMIINKTGEELDTEYTVKARKNPSPLYESKADMVKLLGRSAEDSQLYDLNRLREQFADEPEKPLLVWNKGWKALKDEDDEPKPKGKATPAPASKKGAASPASAVKAAMAAKQAVEGCPKLKSRCSVCGDQRYKTPGGNVCANGHGGVPILADGERPSNPSREYCKLFPELEEEAVEEEEVVEDVGLELEEAEEPVAPPAKPKKPAPAASPDPDEGLDDLDAILKLHSKAAKK